MGVPALFRWLSKKYPKIISPVEEEEETKCTDDNGTEITVPVNISLPNPNGVEFDNLYLDMNGIVHPCTHPEGKPAPETEEEMMVEVFKYTERVVSMIRPRKLLFMAIDGVAPRAKMNQQRSRRFRSAQEAKDKEEARKESVALWEAMGKTITEEEKNKEAWDSNAITPGTPFMDLLASSLRYWVVRKINTDPAWQNIQVLISDAGVPGEGEHKIMDYIRRQRSNPGHDPNTRHVIYGLDADLIMLSLATHEPNFRVLREDVFANDTKPNACRMCGQEGHYAAQCTGTKAEIEKKPPSDKKPFIFLDVAILREYLEVELDVPTCPIPFNLEQAIDDWVLLIFFVGNDFLPHLPSLEIREGAIDTLLKIWKQELPRMGGYLTNHGDINLARAQIILEGLAKREDEIFRRRREAEERQDQNAKRRKLEQSMKNGDVTPSSSLNLTSGPAPPSAHPSLPPRPTYDFAAKADSIGLGATPTAESIQMVPVAAQALAGSNRDIVANRRAIRLANMSAAEVLKAELSGLSPVKPSAVSSLPAKPAPLLPAHLPPKPVTSLPPTPTNGHFPSVGAASTTKATPMATDTADSGELPVDEFGRIRRPDDEEPLVGHKRKYEEGPGGPDVEEDVVTVEEEDEDAAPDAEAKRLEYKVNSDGTVTQEDTVKLWEPGYRERYYKQKFGIEANDAEFVKNITTSYIEGLCWVLRYYYQGTPSWQWYYPYHFAPFAQDFQDVDKMDIKFDIGQPFKPFEQLMGVFPAASRKHIPEVFQRFMTDEDSPIIDFYPTTFQIDMNGKRMVWQGVALLPFIDEKRLLDAMAIEYPNLTEEEKRRNKWGNDVMFAGEGHPIYAFFESLYGKRKKTEPVPMDPKESKGINGSVLPNPDCLPGYTYYSPLTSQGLLDIRNDKSLSALYYFPKQLTPHRSVLLPGARPPPRVLSAGDLEFTRNSGRGRGRGRGGPDRWEGNGGRGGHGSDRGRNDPFHTRPNSYNTHYGPNSYANGRGGPPSSRGGYEGGRGGNEGGRGGYAGGRGGNQYSSSHSSTRAPYQGGPPPQSYGGYGGGYGGGGAPPSSSYGGYGSGPAPPSRGGPPTNYGSYGRNDTYGGYGSGGSYGGYGGGGPSGPSGGYGSSGGGYGGYGGNQSGGYGSGYGRGGPPNGQSRGRGRGGHH